MRPDSFNAILPTTALGRYQIVERLGAGGMAEVLVAVRHGAAGFAKAVALKRIRSDLAGDDRFRTMLRREAALAAMLQHPNCVNVMELEEIEGELVLCMELLHGIDLSALSRAVPLSPAIISRIVGEAARGLHHAHELRGDDGRPLGIVHRDVSPQNLFVTDLGLTKVLDFGIATAVEVLDSDTRTGTIKGKYRFMSPEQADLRPLDARTDVWALGVVTWELLAGRSLFSGQPLELLAAIREAKVPRLAELDVDLPPEVDELLQRALARRSSDRISSAAELADALARATPPAPPEEVAALVQRAAGERIEALRAQVTRAMQVEDRLAGVSHPSADARPPRGARSISTARAEEPTAVERPTPALQEDEPAGGLSLATWTEDMGIAEAVYLAPEPPRGPRLPDEGRSPARAAPPAPPTRTERPVWLGDVIAFVVGAIVAGLILIGLSS